MSPGTLRACWKAPLGLCAPFLLGLTNNEEGSYSLEGEVRLETGWE